MAVTLVEMTRGDLVETRHSGDVVITRADGTVIWSLGNPHLVTYMRSSAKPVQAIAAVEVGAVERFSLAQHELAVMCASHGGEPYHTQAVLSILARIGLAESDLGCGTHAPSYGPAAADLYHSGRVPSAVHNNCSGKHSGMLAAAVALNAPTATYLDPGHPVQQRILDNIAAFGGITASEVLVGVDGCSAPVFGVPLSAMATMFARLVEPDGLPPAKAAAARRITAAMQAHPMIIAGTGRFDTDLQTVAGDRVITKGGAEGVHCIGVPALGLGIAIKIEGGRGEATMPVAIEALRGLGVLDSSALGRLERYRRPEIKNVRGVVVGHARATFTFEGV